MSCSLLDLQKMVGADRTVDAQKCSLGRWINAYHPIQIPRRCLSGNVSWTVLSKTEVTQNKGIIPIPTVR